MQQQQRLLTDRIEIEVTNILVDLNVAEELLVLAAQEVGQAETLAIAEQERFANGASDFFLVNIYTHHIVANVCENCSLHQANIADAKDTDLLTGIEIFLGSMMRG